MMKLNKQIIKAGLAIMVMSSCTDLEEQPFTFVAPTTFYANEAQLDESLMSVYGGFRDFAGDWVNYHRLEGCTEFAQPNRNPKDNNQNINDWYDVNSGNNSGTFTNVWAKAYVCINRANTVLERGKSINMSETAKDRIYAQARFLRAYSYYWLVRIFGGVPIKEGVTEGLDGLEIPRNTVDEVYDYIIADLEYAEANLPLRGQADYDVWRVSKGAAQALLGELYLFRGSMNDNSADYQKCVDYCKKVIDSGAYRLIDNYKDLWYAFNPASAKNNAESIYELQYSVEAGQVNWMHQMLGTYGDSFYSSLGGMFVYLRSAPSVQAWESYDPADKRLDVLISKGKARKGGEEIEMEFVASDLGQIPGSKGWRCCAPGNAKYYDFTTDASIGKAANNWMVLRYSEVLLNYAEALNLLQPGSSDALAKLNMVHQRAGLAPLSITSQKELDDAIFRERGWEFIGEGKLYFDELRTDRLGKNVYEFVNKYHAMGYAWFRELHFVPQKTFLWKIPKGDLNSNPALEQNPDNVSDPRYPLGNS